MHTKTRYFFILLTVLILTLSQSPSLTGAITSDSRGSITVETKYEEQRGNYTIEIHAHNLEDLAGGSFELRFDGSMLNARSLKPGDALHKEYFDHNLDNNSVKVAWAAAEGKDTDGTLFEMEYRLTSNGNKSEINLHNVQLFDDKLNKLDVDVINGGIKPFDGDTRKSSKNVKPDHPWTITFSNPVHRSTVNRQTIYVVNNLGQRVQTRPDISSDGKQITLHPPVGNYKAGDFTLVITDQIRTPRGTALKQAVKMDFSIE
jgi:hypothetical protein